MFKRLRTRDLDNQFSVFHLANQDAYLTKVFQFFSAISHRQYAAITNALINVDPKLPPFVYAKMINMAGAYFPNLV